MTSRSQVNLSWGTAAEIAATALTDRELIVDTTNHRLVLMNGAVVGGFPVASEAFVTTAVAGGGGGAAGNFSNWLYSV